jgi:hypothetical protein
MIMKTSGHAASIEEQIDQWRNYLSRRQAIQSVDVAELEDHLREQIGRLTDAGLAPDEAFLVGVKRMGELDAISREFAREHSDRLWKQLVVSPSEGGEAQAAARRDAVVAFALAAMAAALIKSPLLFGITLDANEEFYLRNLSFFVLPVLTIYFVWKRRLDPRSLVWFAGAFVAAAAFINAYPFVPSGNTEVLAALHLPIALWLVIGIAYAGGRWRQAGARMDFIRFSGELFIYYVLIALGGIVLMGFMAMIFEAAGIDIEPAFEWIVPCGAAGAVIVAAWLVEAKQSLIENMAPVLARLFTPLFAAVLIAFLATLMLTGRAIDIERNALIAFDLLLVLVLGLLLYSISARDPQAPPGAFDAVQVVLVVGALLADAVALSAIAARIGEFGFTPNRVAALGENLILLVNLAWSAVLYIRFLRRRGSFAEIERWQTNYLPVFAAWAAIVVIVFPPMFGFI